MEWKDEEYTVESNKRHKLERFWKKHRTVSSKLAYLYQKNLCAHLAKQKMSAALSVLINDRERVSDLFKLVYKVLDRDTFNFLPDCSNDVLLANDFNEFYITKIDNIRREIPFCSEKLTVQPSTLDSFNDFSPITVDYLHNVIKGMGKLKTSPSDPLPVICIVELH